MLVRLQPPRIPDHPLIHGTRIDADFFETGRGLSRISSWRDGTRIVADLPRLLPDGDCENLIELSDVTGASLLDVAFVQAAPRLAL